MVKYNQSEFAIKIAKWLVAHFQLEHLDYSHILFIRSPIDKVGKPCEIYRTDSTLILAYGHYYIVEIYPTFDLQPEHMMYRNIYHCLRHIPKDYKQNNYLLNHDIEAFDDELAIGEDFKDKMEAHYKRS